MCVGVCAKVGVCECAGVVKREKAIRSVNFEVDMDNSLLMHVFLGGAFSPTL